MSTTIGNLKAIICSILGRTAVADAQGIGSIDLALFALNAARRRVERMVDFRYSEINGSLSITNTGGLFSAITGLGTGSTIKNVINVMLPVAGGDYIATEFLREREWTDRVTRAIGRQPYDATKTLADLGMASENPIAYQQAQTLFLAPASQFTFPVAAKVNCVRFLADYTADADTDFFTTWAPEYLQWQGVIELNKLFRRFVPKEESNISEDDIIPLRDEAQQSLLEWNSSLDAGTSTPPSPPQPSPEP